MSEQRNLLAETVDRLFRSEAAPVNTQSRSSWIDPLWNQVEELGIPLLFVSEEGGGIAGGWEDALVVLQATGRNAVNLPIGEAMLGARFLGQVGIPQQRGPLSVAPRVSVQLIRKAGDTSWRFTGTLHDVPWGRHVNHVVALMEWEGAWHVVLLLREAAASVAWKENLAGEPRDALSYQDAEVTAVVPAGTLDGRAMWEACALLRVGQISGALEMALERSVTYAQERAQFGKPIGKFQAVQQQLALLGAEAAAVACAARAACRAADRGEASFEVAAAKLRANIAIDKSTTIAHQVHGAIGFTHEYELRQATQRLWYWRSEFGNDRYWSECLGAAVASRGATNFWPDLTGRGDNASVQACLD